MRLSKTYYTICVEPAVAHYGNSVKRRKYLDNRKALRTANPDAAAAMDASYANKALADAAAAPLHPLARAYKLKLVVREAMDCFF